GVGDARTTATEPATTATSANRRRRHADDVPDPLHGIHVFRSSGRTTSTATTTRSSSTAASGVSRRKRRSSRGGETTQPAATTSPAATRGLLSRTRAERFPLRGRMLASLTARATTSAATTAAATASTARTARRRQRGNLRTHLTNRRRVEAGLLQR